MFFKYIPITFQNANLSIPSCSGLVLFFCRKACEIAMPVLACLSYLSNIISQQFRYSALKLFFSYIYPLTSHLISINFINQTVFSKKFKNNLVLMQLRDCIAKAEEYIFKIRPQGRVSC